MPLCLADRLGAALGALGSGCSWSHSTGFSEAGPDAGMGGKEWAQRARRARLSPFRFGWHGDVGLGRLEHWKALDGVFPGLEALYSLEVDRWKTNAVARLPEGTVDGRWRLVWVTLIFEQIENSKDDVNDLDS